MTASNSALDAQDLENRVRRMYREVAVHPEREFHFETGRALAERLGYTPQELYAIPAPAIDSFAGVGYFLDLAAIRPGDTVVDLGSGSGMDSLIAARAAGPNGRVIGIDMTEEQLAKSQRMAVTAGLANATFRFGHIESLPLPDASADVVISNGVVNLSPDKAAVFAEAERVLRPGGRLALADIVTRGHLPESVTCDASLWAACIGGAMQFDDYRAAIERGGLEIRTVRENDQYRFLSDRAVNATRRWGVVSISLLAVRG